MTETDPMAYYLCSMCTYVYKPQENNNIPFSELPDDWVCPVCDAPKEEFELYEGPDF